MRNLSTIINSVSLVLLGLSILNLCHLCARIDRRVMFLEEVRAADQEKQPPPLDQREWADRRWFVVIPDGPAPVMPHAED